MLGGQKKEESVVPKERIKTKRGTRVRWEETKETTRQEGPHLCRAKQRIRGEAEDEELLKQILPYTKGILLQPVKTALCLLCTARVAQSSCIEQGLKSGLMAL